MPTTIHYDLLDAFSSRPFSGNPAAVVTLDKDTKAKFDRENLYQSIAAEINMPATGFVTPLEDGKYDICWWHPGGEINLCGHASLATSKALFNRLNAENGGEGDGKKAAEAKTIEYISKVGPLKATLLDDGRVELGFPAAGLAPIANSCDAEQIEGIKSILKDAVQDDGVEIMELQRGVGDAFDNWLIVKVECSRKALKDLSVKLDAIRKLAKYNLAKVSLTAQGTLSPTQTSGSPSDFHIISRMFAPAAGHGEDQVTGSMHCLLAPFWTGAFRQIEGVGTKELALKACQASTREGRLEVVWREEEEVVLIRGDAFVMGKGEMTF